MKFIILFSCLLLFLNLQAHAQDPILRECDNSENYTANSQFQTNLNLLLRTLRSNGGRNGFFNSSTGSIPDVVYGLVQCRGDASMEDCQTCLNNITADITQRCPAKKDVALRYSDCILRYSDQRFFSQVDSTRWWAAYNTANITEANIDRFNQQLGQLMNNLSDTAASRPNRYDSGSVSYTIFDNIYGMVQCNRDLTPTGCRVCLQSRISWIPNCCNSKQGARIYSTTCDIRFEIYPFIENQPVSLPPPPPVTISPPQTTNNTTNTVRGNGTGKGKSTKVVAIVLPIIASVVLLLGISLLFITRRAKKNKRKEKPGIIYEKDDIGREDSLQFDLDTIRIATNGFSDANKLGEGGFGAVYKGELLDGQEIAVKRLSKNSGQGSQEFKNEVILLHKLQHRNLVRLLGFYLGEEEKLLIYEFVPNTSLDKYIFDRDRTKRLLLDWERRYKIIGGIARGLLYLHEDSRLRIIHRDLKCGNILLDVEMNAKIANFGMAKLFGVDQTQGNTSKIVGTFGYMAPEYALHGLFSVKSDVYSFGVLLLEIISGQKTNNFNRSGPSRDLLSYTWKLWRDGNALQLMDPILVDSYSANEVMRCIHIGLLCVQDNLDKRPTMSSVVLMLDSYSISLETPFAPVFLSDMRTGRDDNGSDVESNDSINNSLVYSLDKPSSIKEV